MNDTSNRYAGEYKSAIARAKRVLVAAGLPWSVTTGRYTPFFNQQKTSRGLRVTRIGCSDTVSLSAWGMNNEREASRELFSQGLAAVRAAGLPFDDRGWLDCNCRTA